MNILIVGVGGIGSYLTRELHKLLLNEQIKLKENSITLLDFDEVEIKNIKYQNFNNADIGKNKAKVLSERYCLGCINAELTRDEQLKPYDFIICCVDNAQTRKLIFEHCFKNDKYFIDTRAEGRAVAIFTAHRDNDFIKLIETLPKNNERKSCQLSHELNNNIIQQGNIIVATMCSQLILNKLRGENNLAEYIYYF